MKTEAPLIVGIGGTMRAGSTSEMALSAALGMARKLGMRTRMLSGAALVMDAYEPGTGSRSANALALVTALREADGILISSPSYHGSISGLLKNAIDYTEDMRGDERPYFDGRAVGCIVCADGAQAMGSTLFTMRSIVHALRGWPTPYAAAVNSGLRPFEANGDIKDLEVARQLQMVVSQVVEFSQRSQLALAVQAGQSTPGVH
ncbi:MAG: NAD(P)H-dependent oxidoreductase [Pseudomonadota bacterium]